MQRLLPDLLALFVAGSAVGQPPPASGPPGVVVAEATRLAFPLAVEGLGTARANESLDVRPQISERITAIHFEEGAAVAAGDVLVELEDSQARAAVASARAELVDAESRLRRGRELLKTNTVSSSEVEQRTARRDAARAALDAAEAQLKDTVVRAPFAGRLGLRRVSIGSLVTPQTVITTLDQTDPIKLDFDVPETALGRLAEDLPVVARSAAWRDTVFHGRVASIDTRVDPVSRSITVRALVPNPDGRLRPGMFLTVKLLRDDVTALVIPEQAIVPEQSRQYVFVAREGVEGHVVEKREVRTGRRRPGQVEIVGGLEAGELIVAEGVQKVQQGDAVEIAGRLAVEAPDLADAREPGAPVEARP